MQLSLGNNLSIATSNDSINTGNSINSMNTTSTTKKGMPHPKYNDPRYFTRYNKTKYGMKPDRGRHGKRSLDRLLVNQEGNKTGKNHRRSKTSTAATLADMSVLNISVDLSQQQRQNTNKNNRGKFDLKEKRKMKEKEKEEKGTGKGKGRREEKDTNKENVKIRHIKLSSGKDKKKDKEKFLGKDGMRLRNTIKENICFSNWKRYIDRECYCKQRYPSEFNDRQLGWKKFNQLISEIERSNTVYTGWIYIDFARMALNVYKNWAWFEIYNSCNNNNNSNKNGKYNKYNRSNNNKNNNRVYDNIIKLLLNISNRVIISNIYQTVFFEKYNNCNEMLNDIMYRYYYDDSNDSLWCKKFIICMDFNMFLFENDKNTRYINNIQATVHKEHLLLSLANVNKVYYTSNNNGRYYFDLKTARKSKSQMLHFFCQNNDSRKAWCDELEYRLEIIQNLLKIPYIELKIADRDRALWLPVPQSNTNKNTNTNAKTITITTKSKGK